MYEWPGSWGRKAAVSSRREHRRIGSIHLPAGRCAGYAIDVMPGPELALTGGEDRALAPRANWKGFLKIAEVICPVALYTAASTSERIAFHTVNRATGHRVHRQFVDSETGDPVEKDDQVKGYETSKGEYVVLESEEVAAAVPESDKALSISAFIACRDIDDVYFDRPYYLAPSDKTAEETFALIREGMRNKQVAAIARAVLFRRVRTLLIRAYDSGLIATTLNFDYEVRSAKKAFSDVPKIEIKGEMLLRPGRAGCTRSSLTATGCRRVLSRDRLGC